MIFSLADRLIDCAIVTGATTNAHENIHSFGNSTIWAPCHLLYIIIIIILFVCLRAANSNANNTNSLRLYSFIAPMQARCKSMLFGARNRALCQSKTCEFSVNKPSWLNNEPQFLPLSRKLVSLLPLLWATNCLLVNVQRRKWPIGRQFVEPIVL